jgi:lactoylglutathione lyase
MKLCHVALWTRQPEVLRDFYTRWLGGKAGERYSNPAKNYESWMVTFNNGVALEIMNRPDIPDNLNDRIHKQHQGLIHLAFELPHRMQVDLLCDEMVGAGFPLLDGPRVTGDGYYEFCTADPDGNRVEITSS